MTLIECFVGRQVISGIDVGVFNRLLQAGLVAFDRKQIVRILVQDRAGNVVLAAHGID